jgi:transmembrane sensor
MSNIFNFGEREISDQTQIENEAAEWIVQLNDAEPTEEDLVAFRAWMNTSSAHQRAFNSLVKTWGDMDVLNELAFTQQEKRDDKSSYAVPRVSFAFASLAVVFLLSLVIFTWQFLPGRFQQEEFKADYVTKVGELREIALPDGSGIRLNTKSRTSVSFKQEARLIHLLEGEAHFEVEHDELKPFIVYAGKIAVRAIGTAFSVYLKDDGVDVIVTDGEVKIASLQKAITSDFVPNLGLLEKADTVASFVKGQHAVFKDKIELVEAIEHQEIAKKLSWLDGMLIFDGDSLHDVVTEVSRYTSKEIVILDEEIQSLKIGGYFRAGEITPMLDTLATNFDIKVEEINDNLIYLSQK